MEISHLEKLEQRAASRYYTLQDLCDEAGMARSTITRSKQKGSITVQAMRRLTAALDSLKTKGK